MAEDKMSKDIRARIRKIATTGGKYFKGTAKLFLGSTSQFVATQMPTIGSFAEANEELASDIATFIRDPKAVVDKSITDFMETEDVTAVKKLFKYAWEDLKSGDFYDPNRDRDSIFSTIDDGSDSFGGFDLSGFDENGDWSEPISDADNIDVKIAEAQENNSDKRTSATIGAISAAGTAVVSSGRLNTQASIRASLKQHAQLMSAVSNMVTYQGATVEAVNTLGRSMVDISRESHQQIISQLTAINETLNKIVVNTTPAPVGQNVYKRSDSLGDTIFGSDGMLNIKNYFKEVVKNADREYGITDMLSMATMGGSISDILTYYYANPLMILSDAVVDKLVPKELKAQMQRTNSLFESFFPALLSKFGDIGKRANSSTDEKDSSLLNIVLGMFGLKERSRTGIDTQVQNLSAQASITNRTVHAIEQVIPMWLSRIYSALSGSPIEVFNYGTGKFERATTIIGREVHSMYDLASRSGSGYDELRRRASNMTFQDDEVKREFNDYLYQWMQKQAEDNAFITPYLSREEFASKSPEVQSNRKLDQIKTAEERKVFYNELIQQMLRGMAEATSNISSGTYDMYSDSRRNFMSMAGDIAHARRSRDRNTDAINSRLREHGLQLAFSGVVDPQLESEINRITRSKSTGLTADDESNLYSKYGSTGTSFSSIARDSSSILSILKRGIITYTYIMGGGGIGDTPLDSSVMRNFERVWDESSKESSRINQFDMRKKRIEEDEAIRRNEDLKQRKILRTGMYGDDTVIDFNTSPLLIEQQQHSYGETVSTTGGPDNTLTRSAKEAKDSFDTNLKRSKFYRFITAPLDTAKTFLTEVPFKFITKGLQVADDFMFRVIYGEDAMRALEKNQEPGSIISVVENTVKTNWKQAKDWFTTNIGEPLKNFFFGENGIFTGIRNRLQEDVFGKFKTFFSDMSKRLTNRLIGEDEVVDGQKTGRKIGGMFSGTHNTIKGRADDFRDKVNNRIFGGKDADGVYVPGVIDRMLYGDYYDNVRKGVGTDRDGNTDYQGLFGTIKKGIDNFSELMFGKEGDGDPKGSREKAKFVADELNKAFPDMLIGAGALTAANLGFGLLTGIALPGGPLVAPLLGAGIGFAKSSTAFQNFLFGEQEMEDDGVTPKVDKNGNPVYKKGKEPKISPEIQAGFKKYFPKVGAGFAIGAISGGIFPFMINPVIGGIIGSMGGMIAGSDAMKQALFGTEDDPDSGLISKNMRSSIADFLKKRGGGAIGGFALSKIILALGSGVGIIPGGIAALLGPLFTGLSTVFGAVSGPRIMDALFGEKATVEETKMVDGKEVKVTKDKRVGGLFGDIFDYARDNIMTPIAKKLNVFGGKINTWFEEQVVAPFVRGMKPLHDALGRAGTAVSDTFDRIGDTIYNAFNNVFERNVGQPMGEFFKTNVIDRLNGMVDKLFNTIGKVIGGILSAPFKALEFAFAGTIDGMDPDEYNKQKRQERKDRKKQEREEARRRRRSSGGENFISRILSKFADRRSNVMTYTESYPDSKSDSDEPSMGLDLGESFIPKEFRKNDTSDTMNKMRDAFTIPGSARNIKINEVGDEINYYGGGEEVFNEDGSTPSETKTPTTSKIKPDKTSDDIRSRLKDVPVSPTDTTTKSSDTGEYSSEDKSDEKEPRGLRLRRRKSDNDWLSDIASNTKVLPKIYDEIKGQLGGSGWNIAYIRTLLEKKFGKLSPEELPAEMEGSKSVRKKRGVLGRLKDVAFGSVGNFFGGIANSVGKIKDSATDALYSFTDMVFGMPVRLIKGIGTVFVDSVNLLKDAVGGAIRTFGAAISNIIVGGSKLVGGALAGFGKMINAASPYISEAFGGAVSMLVGATKNAVLAATGLARGLAETVAVIAPEIAAGLIKGLKFGGKVIGKSIMGTLKLAGAGIKGAFGFFADKFGDKSDRPSRKKSIGTFKLDGGYLDKISESVPIGVAGASGTVDPFPLVTVVRGIARRHGNKAVPVYILGIDRYARDNDSDDGTNGVPGFGGPAQSKDSSYNRDNSVSVQNVQGSDDVIDLTQDHYTMIDDQGRHPLRNARDAIRNAVVRAKQKLREWKRAYMGVDREAETSLNPNETYDRAIDRADNMNQVEAILASEQTNDSGNLLLTDGSKSEETTEKKSFFETITEMIGSGTSILATITGFLGTFLAMQGIAEGDISKIGRVIEVGAQSILRTVKVGGEKLGKLSLKNIVNGVTNSGFVKGIANVGKSAKEFIGMALNPAEYNAAIELGTDAISSGIDADLGRSILTKGKAAKAVGSIISKPAALVTKIVSGVNKLVTGLVDKILGNSVVQSIVGSKAITKAKSVASRIASLIADKAANSGLKNAASSTVESVVRFLGGIGTGGLLTIGFAIADFFTGMGDSYKMFGVAAKDATTSMKFAGGVTRAIGGALSSLPAPLGPAVSMAAALLEDQIAQILYNAVASDEAREELAQNQADLQAATDAYNEANGTDLTAEEYSKKFNNDGTERTGIFGTIANGAKKVGSTIAGGISKLGGTIGKGLSAAWDTATNVASAAKNAIVDFASDPLGSIVGVVDKGLNLIGAAGARIEDAFTVTLPNAIGEIGDFFTALPNNIKEASANVLTTIYNGAEDFFSSAASIASNFFGSAYNMVENAFTSAGEFLMNIPENASKIVNRVGTFITSDIPTFFDGLFESVSNTLKDAVTGVFKGAGDFIGSVTSAISKGVSGLLDTVGGFFTHIKDEVAEGYYTEKEKIEKEREAGKGPMRQYRQGDPKWAKYGFDMKNTGCGPTVAAMVASAYGKGPSTPDDADQMSRAMGMRASDGGTNPDFFKRYAAIKGFSMSEGPTSSGLIKANLAQKKPVVFMGKGGAFGNNMHYLVGDSLEGNDQIRVSDPITGGSKFVNIKNIVDKTASTIYSGAKSFVGGVFGKGPKDLGVDEENSVTTTSGKMSTAAAQNALVNKMASIIGRIKYDAGGPNDPDQGSASCASTVGWAYRKVLGLNNMSITSREQAKDDRFTTIWKNNGNDVLDPSILQPGDILYSNMSEAKNLSTIGHTEMYAGSNKDLSHGGPGAGPQWKNLNDWRKERTIMVRRYTPFMNGEDVKTYDTGMNSTISYTNSGTSYDTTPTDASVDTSKSNQILNGIGSLISGFGSQLGNAITALLGGTVSTGDSDSSTSSGSSSNTTFSGTATQYDPTESANRIHKFLLDNGYTPVGASGIMGCWQNESTNRADVVEGYYMQNFPGFNAVMASNQSLNDYTVNRLFPMYQRSNISINKNGYIGSDGNYYPGIGLAQWTGDRGRKLLEFAKSNGGDWRELDTQLKFYQTEANDRGLREMLNSAATPSEAAQIALDHYEMYPGWSEKETGKAQLQKRANAAESIYSAFQSTTSNDTSSTVEDARNHATDAGPQDYGTGPSVDYSPSTTNLFSRIRSINDTVSRTMDIVSNDNSISKLTDTITNALNRVQTATSGTTESQQNYTEVLGTISTLMSTMVQLLTKIAENTSKGDTNTTSSINRALTPSTGAPVYPNGVKSPDDVGAPIIARLTGI